MVVATKKEGKCVLCLELAEFMSLPSLGSLLSEDHATRLPKRFVDAYVNQISVGKRTLAVIASNAIRHALDLPSKKTNMSAWPVLLCTNLQAALPMASFHAGTFAHDGPSLSCRRSLEKMKALWLSPALPSHV